MWRSKFVFDILFPTLLVCWGATLVFSAIASDTGYRALAELREKAREADAELASLRARREVLERQADLLNSKSLDPDLVDERIRTILGYSLEGDVLVSRREMERLLASQ